MLTDSTKPVFCLRLAFLTFQTSENNQYLASSKPVEFQLSTRFPCRLIASIRILFTARNKPVLLRRLAFLTCRYLSSNNNQYCGISKAVDFQLSTRHLCRLIASIRILFTARNKPVLLRRLAFLTYQYLSSNNNQYCGISKAVDFQLSTRHLCRLIASIRILFTARNKPILLRRLA